MKEMEAMAWKLIGFRDWTHFNGRSLHLSSITFRFFLFFSFFSSLSFLLLRFFQQLQTKSSAS